jgi:hypothetical protein
MTAALSRRTLLRLAAASAGVGLLPAPGLAARGRPVLDLAIAGTAHHRYASVAALLRTGERLVLRREPGNRFDANAIEILRADGTKLGYVPRRAAVEVAPLIDGGAWIEAEITGFLARPAPQAPLALPEGLFWTGVAEGEPVVRLVEL